MGEAVNQKAYSRIWRDYFLLQKQFKSLQKDKENLLKIIKDVQSIGEHAINQNGALVSQYEKSGSWNVVNSEAVNFGICKGKVDAYTTINKFIVSELLEVSGLTATTERNTIQDDQKEVDLKDKSGIKKKKGGLNVANDSELI